MGIDTNVTTITNQNSLFLQYSRGLITLMTTRLLKIRDLISMVMKSEKNL